MLTAQMPNGADKAMAAVSVVITAARPVAIVGKKLEHEIEQLHRFCDFRFEHRFACLRSGLQTHGITGRPNPHRARVRARFSGGRPNRQGGPEVRIRLPPARSLKLSVPRTPLPEVAVTRSAPR